MQTISESTGGMLREKHVLKQVPVAHSTLWNWVRDKKFPAPIKLSEKVSVWSQDEVSAWIEAKFQKPEADTSLSDASPKPSGQPLADAAVGQGDPPVNTVGIKKRGGENG